MGAKDRSDIIVIGCHAFFFMNMLLECHDMQQAIIILGDRSCRATGL